MISQEQELRVFAHFFNQLRTLLGNNDNEINEKLKDLFFNPLTTVDELIKPANATMHEFIEKHKFGAGNSSLTTRGREYMNNRDNWRTLLALDQMPSNWSSLRYGVVKNILFEV